MSSAEPAAAPAERTCCVCWQREPIACGVCLGVSAIVDDVDWWTRSLERAHGYANKLRAELELVRADVLEQNLKRTEAEEVAADTRELLELERANLTAACAERDTARAELLRARRFLAIVLDAHTAALDEAGWSTDERAMMDTIRAFVGGA